MAVTFHSNPNNYAPSDNPLTYTFSSTQTAQANFSFKVEVLLNGIIISEDKVFVEVGTRAHFDASTYVLHAIDKPRKTNGVATELVPIKQVSLKVTENYGTPPADQASTTSSQTWTFKAGLSQEDWLLYDFATDYVNTKFLTNYPQTSEWSIMREQDVFLQMLSDQTSKTLTIKVYDSADVLQDTYTDTQTYKGWQLNLKSTLLDAVITPSIANIAYFTVQIGSGEIRTFRYNDTYCYTAHPLVWGNRFGGWDTFVFIHNRTNKGKVKASTYSKQFGKWNGTSFDYDLEDGGEYDFAKDIENTGTITTDYITEEIQNWLIEGVEGIGYMLYDPTGYKIPVRITTTSWQEGQGRFEDLFSESWRYKRTNMDKTLKR